MSLKIIPDAIDKQSCADLVDRRDEILRTASKQSPAPLGLDEEMSAAMMMEEIVEYLEIIESRFSSNGLAGAAHIARLRNYALQFEAYHLEAIESITA